MCVHVCACTCAHVCACACVNVCVCDVGARVCASACVHVLAGTPAGLVSRGWFWPVLPVTSCTFWATPVINHKNSIYKLGMKWFVLKPYV